MTIQERLREANLDAYTLKARCQEAANVIDVLVEALTIACTTVARQKETYIRDEDLRVIDTALAAIQSNTEGES